MALIEDIAQSSRKDQIGEITQYVEVDWSILTGLPSEEIPDGSGAKIIGGIRQAHLGLLPIDSDLDAGLAFVQGGQKHTHVGQVGAVQEVRILADDVKECAAKVCYAVRGPVGLIECGTQGGVGKYEGSAGEHLGHPLSGFTQ